LKLNKKIKAFTISEMLVVLILTAIVVGLAFSVLSLVQKHMASIQKNLNQSTQLNTLETSLWLDFTRYQEVAYNALENELMLSSELDSTSYRFSENYIIKETDTFPIEIKNKEFFFVGEKVGNGKVDAIKIETSKVFQNQQLFIHKQNDASVFMN